MTEQNAGRRHGHRRQRISKPEMVAISKAVLAEPDIPFREYEDIFRIRSNGMDWDIGNVVYEPDARSMPRGPTARRSEYS